ncbi:hypothetical protein ACFSJY_14840 [Thalassotalea euphylliae]|uniref:hypothetical protein n=1 Tax=Thalassotalea euphylliae TaxID=1655234 RepID=UPI00363DCA3A
MKDYFYINDRLVQDYSQQLNLSTHESKPSKKESRVSVSLNPKYERKKEFSSQILSSTKLVDNLHQALVKRGLVSQSRPFVMESLLSSETEIPFVFEQIKATKLIFTQEHLSRIPSIKELAVWIADPDSNQLTDEEWTWHGTFLLLPQIHFDDGVYRTVMSGCSALQMLLNGIKGEVSEPLWRGASGEPLGRGSFRHPVEKLVDHGAIEIGERKIETLYRMRYLTNEQCYTHLGVEHRVNDLLGYPIYMAELL